MDDTPVDWEKQKRVKEAQARAERDLLERAKEKDRLKEESADTTTEKKLERMAIVGLVFMACAVVMGFIQTALGQSTSNFFDNVMMTAKIVGLLISGIVFVSSVLLIRLKKANAWGGLVKSSISFLLYLFYCVVLYIAWLI